MGEAGRLHPNKARDIFIQLAGDEPDIQVLAAMAYTLTTTNDNAECFQKWLRSPHDRIRIAACRLAKGPCGVMPEVEKKMLHLIDDPSAEVADEAVNALSHIHRQRQAETLVSSLTPSTEQIQVARIAQAAVTVGDAGYTGGIYPKWVWDLFQSESLRRFPTIRHIADNHVEQSRKKAADEAKQILNQGF